MKTLNDPEPASPGSPANKTEIDGNNTTNQEYKKLASTNHNYCPYQCSSCKTVGNSLLKIQFDNHKDILLEDDSKLIFNLFGRELVK